MHEYTVDYDDTQRAQHRLGDAEKRAWLLPPEHEEAAWQRLPRTCLISMRKLSEPARGSLCRQPSLAWLALPPTPHPHPYPTNPTLSSAGMWRSATRRSCGATWHARKRAHYC